MELQNGQDEFLRVTAPDARPFTYFIEEDPVRFFLGFFGGGRTVGGWVGRESLQVSAKVKVMCGGVNVGDGREVGGWVGHESLQSVLISDFCCSTNLLNLDFMQRRKRDISSLLHSLSSRAEWKSRKSVGVNQGGRGVQ